MNGFTSQIWLDDTFHYCYFLLLCHPGDVSGWGGVGVGGTGLEWKGRGGCYM